MNRNWTGRVLLGVALAGVLAFAGGIGSGRVQTGRVEGASTCSPLITSVGRVEAQNPQRIVIEGDCFGHQAPYDGDSAYLVISDATQGWNAGCNGQSQAPAYCNGNIIHLNVTHWSNNRIVVDGFTGAYGSYGGPLTPGDRLAISVWNPQSNNGLLLPNDESFIYPVPSVTATVGGNCTPVVEHVSRIQPVHNQTITITGRCFGAMPPTSNDGPTTTPYLELHDATQGDWAAGYGGDCLGLKVLSWSHTKIVVNAYSLSCGNDQSINAGDEMLVSVWTPLNPPSCASALATPPGPCPDGPSTFPKTAQ